MRTIDIKFKTHYGCYMKGEIATFPAGQAERLIRIGAADSIAVPQVDRLKQIAAESAPPQKSLQGPENTRHISGPAKTKDQKPAGNKSRGGGRKAGRKK